MSEYISHIAVQDDTAKLALYSREICEAFKICFRDHAAAVRMGSASRGNSTFIIQNIHHYRDRWNTRKAEDRLEDKLAYTLGWITHRAADRYFKPKYGIFDKNPENLHPVDIRILHDVVLYEKVYYNGKVKPFSVGYAQKDMKDHPASSSIDVTQAEAIFGPMYQADLLSLQSFDNSKDAESFLDRIMEQYATFTVDFDRLIEGVNRPDPEDMQQMIEAPNFYNDEDPIIKIARKLQHGQSLTGLSLEEALDTEGQSQYAQVLSKAFLWVREASRYFNRETDKDKTYMFDTFNISEHQRVERY